MLLPRSLSFAEAPALSREAERRQLKVMFTDLVEPLGGALPAGLDGNEPDCVRGQDDRHPSDKPVQRPIDEKRGLLVPAGEHDVRDWRDPPPDSGVLTIAGIKQSASVAFRVGRG